MNAPKKDVLIALVLVLILAGAAAGYRALSARHAPDGAPLAAGPAAGDEAAQAADAPDQTLAADFTVTDTEGNEVRLSDFLGSPVIVNFWASWCPPCKEELPAFDAASQAYGGEIRFLMVDLADGERESVDTARSFVEQRGYAFPLYFDTTGEAAEAYMIYSIPRTLAIDAEGRLVRAQIGAMSEEALASLIDVLLAE